MPTAGKIKSSRIAPAFLDIFKPLGAAKPSFIARPRSGSGLANGFAPLSLSTRPVLHKPYFWRA
jgi:hypothetical protein